MPSYQYTRNISPQDLEPPPPPEYNSKQKAANWWHYHWKWVLGGAVLLALVVYFIVDVAGRKDPDVSVGVLSPIALPQLASDELSEFLAAAWEADGKRPAVQVELFTIDVSEAEAMEESGAAPAASDAASGDSAGLVMGGLNDPYAQMAGTVRLIAAFQDERMLIFLAAPEQAEQYQAAYGMFGQNGAVAPEGTAIEELALRFSEISGYESLPDSGPAGAKAVFAGYWLGIRPLESSPLADDEGGEEAWQAARLLLETLEGKAGSKP